MDVAGFLFDTDDVLYDESSWRRWFFQLLARVGIDKDYREFFRIWQREHLTEVNCGRRDFWDALRIYLMTAGLTNGQADEVLAAAHARRRQLLESVRPFPGVLATTAKLNSLGVPLGIVCDAPWPGEKVDQVLNRLGLAGRFQTIACSLESGSTKPTAASYLTAVTKMRLDPTQVAFVGHDSDELAGAKAVGMSTIAFNYDVDAQADLYLEHFHQLLERVTFPTCHLLAG